MKTVDEGIPFGIYVAKDHNGKYVVDEEQNFLCISSMRGDVRRVEQLMAAAKQCGIEQPQVEFWEGARKVTEDEYEEQKERARDGYVPDKYDIGNLIDEYKQGKIK
jgi:hypothetical protein